MVAFASRISAIIFLNRFSVSTLDNANSPIPCFRSSTCFPHPLPHVIKSSFLHTLYTFFCIALSGALVAPCLLPAAAERSLAFSVTCTKQDWPQTVTFGTRQRCREIREEMIRTLNLGKRTRNRLTHLHPRRSRDSSQHHQPHFRTILFFPSSAIARPRY